MNFQKDVNIWAVFLHFLGDTLSSFFVLIEGLLIYFFPGQKWTQYIDPVCSLFIVVILVWTSVPVGM